MPIAFLSLLTLLQLLLTLTTSQTPTDSNPDITATDPLPAINGLITTSSWGTLEELSRAAVEEFAGREHEGGLNWNYYLGVSQYQQGKILEAIASFEEALSLQPSYGILSSLGVSYLSTFRLDDAVQAYRMALDLADPTEKVRTAISLSKAMRWNVDYSPSLNIYDGIAEAGSKDESLRQLLMDAISDIDVREWMKPSDYIDAIRMNPPPTPPIPLTTSPTSLTINMVSSDWDVHPVSTLSRGLVQYLLESKDVALNVVSMNQNDDPGGGLGGWWRGNITGMIEDNVSPDSKQQDHLYYAKGSLSERTLSLRGLEANICIDLNGRTMGNSLELFNEQICDLQVTYLGLPQTTGITSMDYIITDKSSVGEVESGEDMWYSEMQAILSNQCYMTNDHASLMGHVKDRYPLRLRDDDLKRKVLIANLGNWQKITPEALDAWSNVLRSIEGGVMLFYRHKGSESAFKNVQLEMAARGIHPERVLITDMHPWIMHTWYKTTVDIVLDTIGKAGHTVNLDGEWAGLPIVTMARGGMEGRAGASVTGGGTRDLKEYEELGVEMARDGMLRMGYREAIHERTMKVGGVYDIKFRGGEFLRAMEGIWDVKSAADEKMHFVQGASLLDTSNDQIEVENMSEVGEGKDLINVADGYLSQRGAWDKSHSRPLLLHIGCKEVDPSWTCVDMDDTREDVDIVADMGNLTGVETGSAEAIYASHVLEHRHYGVVGPEGGQDGNSKDVLKEWYRVLKTGGHLMISVPDLEALSSIFVDDRLGSGLDRASRRFYIMRVMFGGNAEKGDIHMAGYDFDILGGFLEATGFCRIKRVKGFGMFRDSSGLWWDWGRGGVVREEDIGDEGDGIPISLNVIARKC